MREVETAFEEVDLLLEMGEEGGDLGEVSEDIESNLAAATAKPTPSSSRSCSVGPTTLAVPTSRSALALAARTRATGPRCSCACTSAGPRPGGLRPHRGRALRGGHGRDPRRHAADRGALRLRLPQGRDRRPPSRADQPLRRPGPPSDGVRVGGDAGHRRRDRHRDQRVGREGRHHAFGRRRRPARQQDQVGGAASRTSRRGSCATRTSGASTRTAPRRGPPEGQADRPRVKRDAEMAKLYGEKGEIAWGARSAATSSTPPDGQRITGRTRRRATSRRSSTVRSIPSWRRTSNRASPPERGPRRHGGGARAGQGPARPSSWGSPCRPSRGSRPVTRRRPASSVTLVQDLAADDRHVDLRSRISSSEHVRMSRERTTTSAELSRLRKVAALQRLPPWQQALEIVYEHGASMRVMRSLG